ncbi:50S ribosomal protein L25 [Candidatus Kaiserbacteria bacterium]|nr:50S ribosomal protein L25 [Candidatus Kaiserbacteria bacterium]
MTIKLPVTVRDQAINLGALRENGNVPAVVYGPKQEAIQITLSGKEFDKVLKEAGESTIVELTGLKETVEVLIKDVDFNPVKNQVVHVDFYAIERGKEMTTHVPLEFVGEAPVEENKLGNVTKVLHEVTVTCLPKDLPSHIDVDLSVLATIEDKIHVSDLKLPAGVAVDMDADETVAVVSVAKEEVEEVSEVDMDSIEVEKKGKEEEVEEKA